MAQTLDDSLPGEGSCDTHGPCSIHNWNSNIFQTLDVLFKVSSSNASTVIGCGAHRLSLVRVRVH
eukprot:2263452-Pyramimonas_sp.AAC.1